MDFVPYSGRVWHPAGRGVLFPGTGRGPDGDEVGRGLVAYDAGDAERIKGRSSADILLILGFEGRTEMVHRDHLVLGRH